MFETIFAGFALYICGAVATMILVLCDYHLMTEFDGYHILIAWPLIVILVIIRAWRLVIKMTCNEFKRGK